MSPLARRVAATIRRRGLATATDRLAIALSGGADSVALTWVLRELADARRCAVAGLIHVHHGLRGADADADEAFCGALAARLDWPIVVARVDTAARARRDGTSTETAARAARYEALDAAARQLDATVVATAHTLDDQAETVLMRLLRGAGTRGLGGIRPRRGIYVRPLLDCRRQALRVYLESLGESFREDASNQNLSISRNRVRHELLPVVERIAPGGLAALARFADLARDDEAVLEERASQRPRGGASTAPTASPGALQVRALRQLPPALARRVVRAAVASVSPGSRLNSRHIEAVRGLAASDRSRGHLDLPGVVVERGGGQLTFRFPRVAAPGPFEHVLPIPGRVTVPETGDVLTASARSRGIAGAVNASGGVRVVAQAASLVGPLVVRSRRPGDRIRPLGSPGRRKVQDVLVDRKVPREERDRVPIVVDGTGRIVWVAGLAMAEECRVTAPDAGVVILELERRFEQ